jgi:anti-anti-sigma factor
MELKLIGAENGILRVEVVGKLSRDGVVVSRDAFINACGGDVYQKPVLLSLQRSLYVDSTGVEWLLTYHKRFESGGGMLICHSPSPVTSQMMKIMRLDRVLHTASSESEAITKAKGALSHDEHEGTDG